MAKFIEVTTTDDIEVLLNTAQISRINKDHKGFAWLVMNNEEIIETRHSYGELKAILDLDGKVLEPRCKAVMVDGDDEDFQEVKRLEDLGHPGFNFEE